MSTTLREVFTQRANDAQVPELDVNRLGSLGESRLRRRRLTAVAGSAAAVVAVIALALGLALDDPVNRGDGPVDRPKQDNAPDNAVDETPTPPVRKLLYSEGRLLVHEPGIIHFGSREVRTIDTTVHMDVTDDGFVYVAGNDVWFSDGGAPEQIGSDPCHPATDETRGGVRYISPSPANTHQVVSGNAGSLVAWFDCSDLVVFDTHLVEEVARQPMEPGDLEAIVGDHVYFSHERLFVYDVASGRTRPVAHRAYVEDLLNHPRALVVGDTWETGTATNGIGQVFHDVGSRLLPWTGLWSSAEPAPTKSFDSATGRAVRLRLPTGYDADPEEDFMLFEWLDDDAVALVALFSGNGAGDILTCRLSDGHCDVAVQRQESADWAPLVPGLQLPRLSPSVPARALHPERLPGGPMNAVTALVILTLATVTACAGGDDSTSADEATSAQEPTSADEPSVSPSEVSTTYTYLGDAQENTELTPGPYALTAYDSPTAPLFVLDVPSGYERYGLLAVLSRLKAPNGDDRYAVGYWAPNGVYADACAGQGPAPDPGPTAKDVTSALSAQEGPDTTHPKPVSVDGHEGWYVELSVPAAADLSRCDAQDLDYFAAGGGSRHTNTAGAVDRLYVIDVSGEVVIIDTGYTPQASAAQIEESQRMVENGQFVKAP